MKAQAYPKVRQAFMTQYIVPYDAADGSRICWGSNNTNANPEGGFYSLGTAWYDLLKE